MLELFGSSYAIEHCIAVFRKRQEDKLFKAYIAECLKVNAELTGRIARATVTIADFRTLAGWIKTDDRTGDEIAEDIIRRAGLKVQT